MTRSASEGVLVDNSVWSRLGVPAVAAVWAAALERRAVLACSPFLLEAGYVARTPAELRRLHIDVPESMEIVVSDATTWEVAFEAQQNMADAAGLMHRRKPMDFLMAATAHQHGLGIPTTTATTT